jgi:hypothetical protein
MGNIGAMSAFHDRQGMSKSGMFFGILLTLCTYYLMYMACYELWTFMAFNNCFSD